MEELPKLKLGASKLFLFDTYLFSIETIIKSVSNFEDPKTKTPLLKITLE